MVAEIFSCPYCYTLFQSEKPYFKDSSTYVMPMSICVRDTPGQCHLAELNVILWLCISPLKTNPEVEAKKDFQLTTTADATNRKFVQQVSGGDSLDTTTLIVITYHILLCLTCMSACMHVPEDVLRSVRIVFDHVISTLINIYIDLLSLVAYCNYVSLEVMCELFNVLF